MGKSLGNFITLAEFFTGSHKDKDGNEMLSQAYSPMTIRFFILQAHYRSTVDFSNEALIAAQRGLERLTDAYKTLLAINPAEAGTITTQQIKQIEENCYEAMNDDFNTPIVISNLFEMSKLINQVADHHATISADALEEARRVFRLFAIELMGLQIDSTQAGSGAAREEAFGQVVDMLLEQRMKAKANKDWATSDMIRDRLAELGFEVKDTKDGYSWKLKK